MKPAPAGQLSIRIIDYNMRVNRQGAEEQENRTRPRREEESAAVGDDLTAHRFMLRACARLPARQA